MEIVTLAERIKSGEYEAVSVEELCKEAAEFFSRAMESEAGKRYKQGIEYCVAAYEDLDAAYENSNDCENFEQGKKRVADMQKRVKFHEHRIKADMYITEKRYYMLLDEILAAKSLYRELLEDNDENIEDFESKFSPYICDLGRLERAARDRIKNMYQLPGEVQLKNKRDRLDIALNRAVAEERYEDAARFRDKIKKLEGSLCV